MKKTALIILIILFNITTIANDNTVCASRDYTKDRGVPATVKVFNGLYNNAQDGADTNSVISDILLGKAFTAESLVQSKATIKTKIQNISLELTRHKDESSTLHVVATINHVKWMTNYKCDIPEEGTFYLTCKDFRGAASKILVKPLDNNYDLQLTNSITASEKSYMVLYDWAGSESVSIDNLFESVGNINLLVLKADVYNLDIDDCPKVN